MFEYEEYTSLMSVSDPNEGYDAVLDLLLLQETLDKLGRDVLGLIRKRPSECITSSLVPIVSETYGIYKFLISMLRGLYKSAASPEVLEPLRVKFIDQHERLYDFYAQCATIRYLSTLITIPKLPFDAPSLTDEDDENLPRLVEQRTAATAFSDQTEPERGPSREHERSDSFQQPAVLAQPTGAVTNAFAAQQQAYQLQQQQLERQQQAQMQQQQQQLEQQKSTGRSNKGNNWRPNS